jgi:preprotein translocase subunit SecE
VAEGLPEEKKSKRRLRASSETVRERNEKLQLRAATPKNPSKVRAFFSGFFWPLRALGHQIGKLGRFRVFRWIGYVLLPVYIRNSWRELRLVTWPTRRQSLQLTNAVIIFSVIFGLLVAVVDFGLDKLFKEFIIK